MGPFVPDIISDELNLVLGFLIGIAFGFVLEQAGFSSSRKLANLFYGRDFTVLRVFFTAAVTAMAGVLLLAHFGLLDIDIIYINPTYLWAAILGGVIMGAGFIIGGYCPGTSVCGAAIGKIDAMVFVLGGLLGVFVFGELYPSVESLYNGAFLGDITVPATFGLSPGMFALLMILFAVAAFMVTTQIERRMNHEAVSFSFPIRAHRVAGGGIVFLGILLLYLPDQKTDLLRKISDGGFVNAQPVQSMTSDELAFRLLDHDPRMEIIDVRDTASYARMTLPGAVNISLEEMFGKRWRDLLDDGKLKVVIAEDDLLERKAAVLADLLGYGQFRPLRGGMKEFRSTILSVPPLLAGPSADERDAYRFRATAGPQITELIRQQAAGPKKIVRTVAKVSGGCGI
jgi:rhodanese-related sulfurtransferase